MKRFIIQTILFIGLFTLLMLPVCAYNKMKLNAALAKEQQLPNGKTVLALGDSHVECSMDMRYFPEMMNKAKSSECYFFNFAKARYYAEQNKINTILVAYNYFSFREGTFKSKLLNEQTKEFYPIYFPLLILQGDLMNQLNQNFFSKEFIQYYGENRWGLPGKKNINSFVHEEMTTDFKGGFIDEYEYKIAKDDPDSKIALHYKEYVEKRLFELDRELLRSIYQLCDYTKANNIRLVFYNAPCHPEYNKRVPKDAIHKMDSLAGELQNKYNAIYLNYHDYPMPNDSCFRDYDHLNTRGAAIITPIVRDTLIKLGIIPNKEIL